MSELHSLISNIVKKELNNLNSIKSVPCRVINILDNGSVQVELITNKARYAVANYCGSSVEIGEVVQLYYRNMLSNNTAYIGASLYKPTKIIAMESKTGLIDSEFSLVSSVSVKNTRDTDIIITYNAVILGIDNNDVEFVIRIDGVEHGYKPIISTVSLLKMSINFSVPYLITKGNHTVEILAKGISNIECANGFVSGQVEKGGIIFDDVTDDDFIYISNADTTDTVLYIGKSVIPKIPDAINEKPVGVVCASTFNTSNVEAVYIPDGVTEIE